MIKFKIAGYKKKELDLIKEIGVEAHHELREKLTKHIKTLYIQRLCDEEEGDVVTTKMEIILHCKIKGIESIVEVTAPYVID